LDIFRFKISLAGRGHGNWHIMTIDMAAKDEQLCGNPLGDYIIKDDLFCGELVGPSTWHIVENPLGTFGNKVEKLVCSSSSPCDMLADAPPNDGARQLFSGSEGGRPIDIQEFQAASQLLQKADDDSFWEVLLHSPKTGLVIKRLAGEPNTGPVTALIQAKLRDIPLEAAGYVLNNFTDRSKWDKQQMQFRCHDDWGCRVRFNSLFYFILRIPPLTDREFLNIFAMATSDDGNAYLTIARDAKHPSYAPRKGCIRASLIGNVAHVCRGDDPGSSVLTLITKQDIKLPVIPHWLINKVFPGQMSNWNDKMQRACRAVVLKSQTKGQLPLSSFFQPRSPSYAGAIQAPDCSKQDVSKQDCSMQDCSKLDCSKQDCSRQDCSKQDCSRWEQEDATPEDRATSEKSNPDFLRQLANSDQEKNEECGYMDDLEEHEPSTESCCGSWLLKCPA